MIILLTVASIGCGGAVSTNDRESKVSSVLFQEFETVMYAKSDLLPGAGAHHGLSDSVDNNLLYPFYYLRAGLRQLSESASTEILKSGDSIFLGARDFLPPTGLGPVRSKRCYVVLLDHDRKPDFRKYFSRPVASVAGVTVWSWNAQVGEFGEGDPRDSTFFEMQVNDSYVLIANDLPEIRTVAESLTRTVDAEAPRGLRDWEFVRHHEVWAYRAYRFGGVRDVSAAGLRDITEAAEALAFWIDPDRRSGSLRLYTSPGDSTAAMRLNAKMRKPGALLPPLEPAGRDEWEAPISLADGKRSFEELFEVRGLFGFATYL
jgi:hypothetical protein